MEFEGFLLDFDIGFLRVFFKKKKSALQLFFCFLNGVETEHLVT